MFLSMRQLFMTLIHSLEIVISSFLFMDLLPDLPVMMLGTAILSPSM